MVKILYLLTLSVLLSGCVVFDKFSSGERHIPISLYAEQQYDNLGSQISKIRPVYTEDRLDVFTYVVAFDGTNNSSDCDLKFGGKTALLDYITSKPFCTTIKRLAVDIKDVPFNSVKAPRHVEYYDGPGALFGRFTNPLDSFFGYTSARISQRALADFERQTRSLSSDIKEIRLVAIGFSRGAAIARDFVNHAHTEWDRQRPGHAAAMWSTLLLYDTVATFQQDKLDLNINPRTEQVIHLVSVNESRGEFRPIADVPSRKAAYLDRLLVMKLPGAHTDIGAGYRFGASVLADYIARRSLQEMGLVGNIDEAYDNQLDFGLVDSRGWWDKIIGTPSGYACDFQRLPQKKIDVQFSQSEFNDYVERIQVHEKPGLREIFASKASTHNKPIAMFASSRSNEWAIIPVRGMGKYSMGTFAHFDRDMHGDATLSFTDGINKGLKIPLPHEVVSEVERQHGNEVLFEITGVESISTKNPAQGIWFFINGCLPMEQTGRRSSTD